MRRSPSTRKSPPPSPRAPLIHAAGAIAIVRPTPTCVSLVLGAASRNCCLIKRAASVPTPLPAVRARLQLPRESAFTSFVRHAEVFPAATTAISTDGAHFWASCCASPTPPPPQALPTDLAAATQQVHVATSRRGHGIWPKRRTFSSMFALLLPRKRPRRQSPASVFAKNSATSAD